ncbi:BON domain-containing protein [Hymenobacter antarcticus]
MKTLEITSSTEEEELADHDIMTAVERLFATKKGVTAHLIDVAATQGIVMLSGYSDNLLARERAEEIAKAVRGVRGVINQIGVRAIDLPDATLRRDVEEALLQDAVACEYTIGCTARDGEVLLLGEVPSWSEKQLILRVAKSVRGVRGVADHLVVCHVEREPPGSKSEAELVAAIQEMIDWDIRIDGAQVQVTAQPNGGAVLSGVVGSAAARGQTIAAAWRAGAGRVLADELLVVPGALSHELRGDKYRPRSDEDILKAIRDCFRYDPRVRAGTPEVEVRDGRVLLRGTVSNLKAQRTAEQDALGVVGVWLVDNYLRVRPRHNVADHDIQRHMLAALLRDPYLQRYAMEVVVHNGKASLYGTVDSQFDKLQAEDVAAGVNGVIAVENRLVVPTWYATTGGDYFACYVSHAEPAAGKMPGSDALTRTIQQLLYWSPALSGQDIEVQVANGRATLTGTVHTPQDRQHAALFAFEGGAHAVDNQLRVRYGPQD